MKNSLRRSKRVLFDVCHPAAVYQFKALYHELCRRGWTCLFVAKEKDVTIQLLHAFRLPYNKLGSTPSLFLEKLIHLFRDVLGFASIVRQFKPDVIVSNVSVHSSWVAFYYQIPHIACIDTEHRRILDAITLPFVQAKLTPQSYQRNLGQGHIRYAGNHELGYLGSDVFKPVSKHELGVSEPYVIVRFIQWTAFHDIGHRGLTIEQKRLLINELTMTHQVYISSEGVLPDEFSAFRLPARPELFHEALYYADAYVGEGATTASEAACLGTPAFLFNDFQLGYIDEERHLGLVHQYWHWSLDAQREIVKKIRDPMGKKKHQKRLLLFLQSKTNVTNFIVSFIIIFKNARSS